MTALRLFGLPTPYMKYDSGRPLGARLVLARPRARPLRLPNLRAPCPGTPSRLLDLLPVGEFGLACRRGPYTFSDGFPTLPAGLWQHFSDEPGFLAQ